MRKKSIWKKVMGTVLVVPMLMSTLYGCGSTATGNGGSADQTSEVTQEAEAATEGESKYPEFITVDVFDSQANFQGIQSGWFGKVVKDKFNMELNIIAPNVAGGGDTLYMTRSANGDLGDLILADAGQSKLQDLVTAELVLDMTDYLPNCEHLQNYMEAIQSNGTLTDQDGIWAIPSQISANSVFDPCEATEPTNAPSLRWDLYKQIGYPTMDTLEDLLPVLQQMQEAAGTSDSGKKVYAFSLFKDWDFEIMHNASALMSLYGYASDGFAAYNVDHEEIQSVLDDDSFYIRSLRFLFNANQMGLVDPESTTQNFDNVSAKYTDGAVIYSLWPWLGTGYYNSTEHTSEGKGFASATIADGKYMCYGNSPLGTSGFAVMIGSKAEDPQRLMDFVDWLYSPEGIMLSAGQTGGNCGPEGLTWEMKDGQPVLTDFGVKVFVDKDTSVMVPEEWGTGTWTDGVSALNYNAVGITEVDPDNGMYYNVAKWDDYAKRTETLLTKDWSEHNDNYYVPIEYFKDKGLLSVFTGIPFSGEEYSTDLSAVKEQCKQIITQYSWQMVFAKDQAEFDSLLKEMQEISIGLGYNDVFEFNKQNCENRYKVINEYVEQHQ